MSSASHRFAAFQVVTVFWVVTSLMADVGGRHSSSRYECHPFSCGQHRNVSPPFRRRDDPVGCGFPSYELACSDTRATIQINTGTYYVTDINYTDFSFWVIDANLDMHSSCPLPRWDQLPVFHDQRERFGIYTYMLLPVDQVTWATFLNCSQEVRNDHYRPVACLSTSSSFVYVFTAEEPAYVRDLEASCGYLAMIPLGGWDKIPPKMASFADVLSFMKSGFAGQFPWGGSSSKPTLWQEFIDSIKMWISNFHESQTNSQIRNFLNVDKIVWNNILAFYYDDRIPHGPIATALTTVRWIAVICRFVFAPLVVFAFLAHKYWKTRITVDAVEKFLRMQQIFSPTRYAYTDIIAITSHFREKLGQGGYGSVYKGVLLPGDVRVAVKMLGNSKCNGEEFISEVATIGRIHRVNVVRLLGFCSEEMKRALLYEYMPNGSLDKYIFSSEKKFSWDKLNEIALGIARGINYLHQGCDLQILHFDIKPHNILLDSNFVPKVADFGLAKLFPRDNTFVPMSAMRGTIGYIAPEMVSRSFGSISSKSDVYSFGMLLLEMAGGRRNTDNGARSSQAYYPSLVYRRLTREEVDEINDTVDMHELEKKMCIIGLWCIQMKSHDRPTMSEVIEMLVAGADGLQMPPRPFFCDDDESSVGDYPYFCSELDTYGMSVLSGVQQ